MDAFIQRVLQYPECSHSQHGLALSGNQTPNLGSAMQHRTHFNNSTNTKDKQPTTNKEAIIDMLHTSGPGLDYTQRIGQVSL